MLIKTYKKLVLSLSMLFVAHSALAMSPELIQTDDDFLNYQRQMMNAGVNQTSKLVAQGEKEQAMMQYAKTIAIRSAMQIRFRQINAAIQANSRNLDAIYNFQPLMIQQRVVPPVITEAKDLYNQENNMQIRLSRAIYNIAKQARFSSTPPNWRDYLNFSKEGDAFEAYNFVSKEIYPKTGHERALWEKASREGWRLGIAQANGILQQAMERLNRDYIGMTLFHEFVLQGKINSPVINTYNLYDNNEGQRLTLDEQLLQIEILPSFQTKLTAVGRYSPPENYTQLTGKVLSMDNNSSIQTPKAIEQTASPNAIKYMSNIRNGDLKANDAQPWLNNTGIVTTPDPLQRPVTVKVEEKRVIQRIEVPVVVNNQQEAQKVNERPVVEQDVTSTTLPSNIQLIPSEPPHQP